MTLLKLLISAAVTLSVTTVALAADPLLEDEIEVETLPNRKLARRGERVSGPITAISAGALVFAGFDSNADYKINSSELASGLAKAFKSADKDGNDLVKVFEMPRRPVIEEDNTIERINRQDREQRRRGY